MTHYKFGPGPILQGPTMADQNIIKSAYISFIKGSRGFQCTIHLSETVCCEIFPVDRFDLGPLF